MDKAGLLNSTEIEIKKLADLLIKGFLNVAQIKKKAYLTGKLTLGSYFVTKECQT